MITEALILSIDYTNATCSIEVPVFETSGNPDKCILTANFSIQPGLSNGYVEGDTVWVGFENNHINQPVVMGKTHADNTDTGTANAISATGLTATGNVSVPATTKVTTSSGTVTLQSLIDNMNTGQSTSVASTQQTITCLGPTTNITGGQVAGFSSKKITDDYYEIYFNGSNVLSQATAATFMYYMTGSTQLPLYTQETPMVVFNTVDGRSYYPVWDPDTSTMQLVILCDETLSDKINRLIDEHGDDVILTNTTVIPATTTTWQGANVTYTDDNDEDKSNKISIVDLT